MKKIIMRKTGTYKKLGDLEYFIPNSLPPRNPALKITKEILDLYGQASFALGQLNEMADRVPDTTRFLKAYVIKEALLSSAIEGIHTTLIEVFTTPTDSTKPNKNTQLVLNYTKALDSAITMLQKEGFPISQRIILKAHQELMSKGAGDQASPGIYRKQQVKVGELVPPSPNEIAELMSQLEKYINEPHDLPELLVSGLVHVQFETIHPFLDGNGRIGRLLIVLMLMDKGLIKYPILYPSYYFKKHHREYYESLNGVRTEGNYEGWIIYYLNSIRESAKDAYNRAKEIENLEQTLNHMVQKSDAFKGKRETANAILELLFANPITTISELSREMGKVYNTAQKTIDELVREKIVSESISNTGRKVYKFKAYFDILDKEYS